MSNYSLINSLLILTDLKNHVMHFLSIFSTQEFEQHLHPSNVFSLLSLFYSYSPTIDFFTADNNKNFENLFFYFVYGSFFPFSSSLLSFFSSLTNNSTVIITSQEEFEVFAKLSLHVFSSFSFFYYKLH
jgi:hypothetical protein